MRQPHSSLVILFQLDHGEDPATVRPLRAEVPVHPLCWFLSKSKYALGMRWTFFRPRTRLTYAPEVEPTLNQQESSKNLAGIRQKFVDMGCILV